MWPLLHTDVSAMHSVSQDHKDRLQDEGFDNSRNALLLLLLLSEPSLSGTPSGSSIDSLWKGVILAGLNSDLN